MRNGTVHRIHTYTQRQDTTQNVPLAALTISSREAFSRSVPLIISLVTVTYFWWCFPWWMSRVREEMMGSRALLSSVRVVKEAWKMSAVVPGARVL